MGTDLVLIAMEYHRYGAVDWQETAVEEIFVSYMIPTGKAYGLNEEWLQAKNRVRGFDGVPTMVILTAFLVALCAGA